MSERESRGVGTPTALPTGRGAEPTVGSIPGRYRVLRLPRNAAPQPSPRRGRGGGRAAAPTFIPARPA